MKKIRRRVKLVLKTFDKGYLNKDEAFDRIMFYVGLSVKMQNIFWGFLGWVCGVITSGTVIYIVTTN